ncbi:hypothetical protein ACF3DV_29715 [Chlorogloeopsis fritschii PCC 9212]|uniref:hypothetical protein n=1 Tax=Chlorogloeopsis fritschii TaxID=1124 RepID=UPI0003682D21|nr:hypothetical protein [Chlorogloeopsis fritschii]
MISHNACISITLAGRTDRQLVMFYYQRNRFCTYLCFCKCLLLSDCARFGSCDRISLADKSLANKIISSHSQPTATNKGNFNRKIVNKALKFLLLISVNQSKSSVSLFRLNPEYYL